MRMYMNTRRVTLSIYSLVMVAGLSLATTTYADTMRCGSKLVFSGDSTYTVKTKCGEPDDANHRTELRTVSHEVSEPCPDKQQRTRCSRTVETSVEVVIDEWTYDFGTHRFIQYLRFEDGRLLHITDGSYGDKSN